MKLAIFATLVTSAAAFSISPQKVRNEQNIERIHCFGARANEKNKALQFEIITNFLSGTRTIENFL